MGKDESRDAAKEEAGSEYATASSAAVCGSGGEYFQEEHKPQVNEQVTLVVVEKGVMHDVPFWGIVDELVDDVVSLTVHDGEKVNEHAQQELVSSLFDAPEDALEPVHGSCEVEADKAASNPQEDTAWDDVDSEGFVEIELEERVGAVEGIGDADGCDARHHQRK